MPRNKFYDPFIYKVDERMASRAKRQGRLKQYIRGASSNYIKRPEVREFVLNRDGHKCVVCESTEHLQIDHITSVYRLGFEANTIDNLQTLCRSCNAGKEV